MALRAHAVGPPEDARLGDSYGASATFVAPYAPHESRPLAVIAAFVINAGLNFVLGLLIAKLLGPADFGRFALATTGAIVLNTVLFEWLRLSATRFYSGRVRVDEPWIRTASTGPISALACCSPPPPPLRRLRLRPGGGGARGRAVRHRGAALGIIGVFDYHAALARARFDGKLYLGLVAVKNVLASC